MSSNTVPAFSLKPNTIAARQVSRDVSTPSHNDNQVDKVTLMKRSPSPIISDLKQKIQEAKAENLQSQPKAGIEIFSQAAYLFSGVAGLSFPAISALFIPSADSFAAATQSGAPWALGLGLAAAVGYAVYEALKPN